MSSMILPLAGWLLLMLLASGAGLALVGAWSWASGARAAGAAFAAGLASAPLIAGLVMALALWLLPGARPGVLIAVVFGALALAALAGLFTGATRRAWPEAGELVPRGPAAVLTWGFFAALGVDAFVIPLIQNDALEYATVGRILFETRDLASYPVLHPERHASGFFGPWTHPPLYVSLVAFAYALQQALQGSGESTTLLRLIAPWCLAGAALCVAALGRWAHPARPDAGALAALLLVSTPLLYLGAASALIDSLPVLGLVLALTALAALQGAWWQRGLGLGVMLGLALWTHSQAVLVPLLLLPLLGLLARYGSRAEGTVFARFEDAAKVAATALAAALLIGAAPYVRNMALFGSPISDNPLVFALPSLDWPGYFKLQRGLASTAELVQYGLLKPWFALEAYAFVFWLALLVFVQRRQPLALLPDRAVHVQTLCLGVIGLYLAGALLSVTLGIDLMVRNERYMLILLPAAALLAAGALNWPLWRGLLVALIALQLAALVVYRLGQLGAERGASPVERLQRWGPYGAVEHLRTTDSRGESRADSRGDSRGVVFSMKPADMFYSGRTMLSYLDPRLVPFYAEREPAAAAARLQELGVTQVHMPDYWLPPVYNSALEGLLADAALTTLAFDRHGYQVYALRRAGGPKATRPGCAAPLSFTTWERRREFVLGGRKNMMRLHLGTAPHPAGEMSNTWNATPLFLRETNTVLISRVDLPAAPPEGTRATGEWVVQLELEGEGYVQALVRPRGGGSVMRLVGDRPLANTSGAAQRMQRRILIEPAAQGMELRLEHRADSRLRVKRAALEPVCE
jgi:hypothetical protein